MNCSSKSNKSPKTSYQSNHVFSVASILRHVYLRGGVGVGALTKVYGGKK